MDIREAAFPVTVQAISLYCCYDKRNRADWDNLSAHLAVLKRLGKIELRHNHDIPVGHNSLQESHSCLDTADIVLLLISHYFFDSDLCWELMRQAMIRHDSGTLQVIPVLLSLVDYEDAPIDKLQMLPRNRPIKQWRNRQAAYAHVVKDIRKTVDNILKIRKVQSQCSSD